MKWVEGARYQIIYLDQNNHISSRYIKILHEREYTLLAFCYERQGIRSFLKEGILGMKKVADDRDWLPTRNYR